MFEKVVCNTQNVPGLICMSVVITNKYLGNGLGEKLEKQEQEVKITPWPPFVYVCIPTLTVHLG